MEEPADILAEVGTADMAAHTEVAEGEHMVPHVQVVVAGDGSSLPKSTHENLNERLCRVRRRSMRDSIG